MLLTGNAGIQALSRACTFAERAGICLPQTLQFMQVPDHGNPDNVSSAVLDRLVGERQPRDQRHYTKSAFISVGRGTPSLGHKLVADALKRRGVMTFMTCGMQLRHSHEMPARRWRVAEPAPAWD